MMNIPLDQKTCNKTVNRIISSHHEATRILSLLMQRPICVAEDLPYIYELQTSKGLIHFYKQRLLKLLMKQSSQRNGGNPEYELRLEIQDEGCWRWLGKTMRICTGSRNYPIRAATLFYMLQNGSTIRIDEQIRFHADLGQNGMIVNTCGNGKCVNPQHHRLVSGRREAAELQTELGRRSGPKTGNSKGMADEVLRLHNEGIPAKVIANRTGYDISNVYRLIKR